MTNGTTPTETGSADTAGHILAAAMTPDTINSLATAAEAAPAEPAALSFNDLDLHQDVKQALDDMGYFAPTPVQHAVFGPVTSGKDLLVQSRTGTGKTTAFGLPLINRIVPAVRQPQALILCPTRELALQVARELTQLGKHRGVLVEPVYGGAPIGKQIKALKDGVHIIVGTPGRVLDHIGRRTLDCRTISTFVLDECDEMLSMGFLEDIERVTSNLPEKHQTLLFSATMPDEVSRYARRHMKNAENLSLSRDSISVTDIHHAYYIVSGIARSRDLLKIILAEEPESAIIFCNMRDETTMVAKFLQKQGLDAEPLSSDLSQADRERVMNRMKAKNLRFLCATDVAARGIDISNLSHVINFSVPEQPEIYVHRTGRTGRAGKKGVALSLVGPRELGNFRYVRLTFGIKPEERLLPKDDIFIGKLKVPLPPIGVPVPPDPVQILIRGVPQTPTDLEKQIFEKLLSTSNGKRVLAQLVAEKLNTLSTRTSGRPARQQRDDGPSEGEKAFDRPERGDRGDRPRFDRDRPRFGEGGGDRGDRPRFDRDRPRFGDRPDRGGPPAEAGAEGARPEGGRPEGGRPEGERFERGDRPRFDRDRGDRPRFDRDRPRFGEGSGEQRVEGAPAGERPEGDRGDRPRFDRDRGGRDRDRGGRDRDRGDRPRFDRDRGQEPRDTIQVQDTTATPEAVIETAPVTEGAAAVTTTTGEPPRRDYRDRGRDRGDRGDRGGRDRDRGERHERSERHEARTEAAPVAAVVVEPALAETITEVTPVEVKVDDVARAALERADRGGKRGRDKKAEPTEATREFWETWAETKATTPAPEAAAEGAEPAAEAEAAPSERGGRGRSRGGRGRGRGGEKETKSASKKDEPAKKEETAGRAKRDTVVAPQRSSSATVATDGNQARLFVSLGKKHGVSADDLRTLLAGPIGGDTARIGSVSLRDSHAHVRVPEELVETIIAAVNGTQHNDHDVTVERSRA